MKKPGLWIVLIFALAFIAVMYTSTRGLSEHRVEVCIEFRGMSEVCRTAAGASIEEATRKAKDNACAFVASGVTDTIACGNTTPTRVTPLDK